MNNTGKTAPKAIRFTAEGAHTYRKDINTIEVTALANDRHKLLVDNFSKEELCAAASELHRGYKLEVVKPSIFFNDSSEFQLEARI